MNKERLRQIEHHPVSFIVRGFAALSDKLVERHPDDDALIQLLKEPVITSTLLLLSAPTVIAYWTEKLIAEISRTTETSKKGLVDQFFENNATKV